MFNEPIFTEKHKNLWVGFILTTFLGSVLIYFSNKHHDFIPPLEILLSTILAMIMYMFVALLVFGITLIFKKEKTFERLLRISIIVSVIAVVFDFIGFVMFLGGR